MRESEREDVLPFVCLPIKRILMVLGLIAAHFITLDNFNREFRFRFELKRIDFKVLSRELITLFAKYTVDGHPLRGFYLGSLPESIILAITIGLSLLGQILLSIWFVSRFFHSRVVANGRCQWEESGSPSLSAQLLLPFLFSTLKEYFPRDKEIGL